MALTAWTHTELKLINLGSVTNTCNLNPWEIQAGSGRLYFNSVCDKMEMMHKLTLLLHDDFSLRKAFCKGWGGNWTNCWSCVAHYSWLMTNYQVTRCLRWQTPIVPAPVKLRQEECKSKPGLQYTASMRPVWTTWQDPESRGKRTPTKGIQLIRILASEQNVKLWKRSICYCQIFNSYRFFSDQ